MELHPRFPRIPKRLGALFFANFFLALHLFGVLYYNSTYLKAIGVNTEAIGSIYALGSFCAILGFILYPRLLRHFKIRGVLTLLVLTEGLAFVLLASNPAPLITIGAFLIYLAVFPLLILSLDVLLEGTMESESSTGKIRGAYLTLQSTALISAPFIAGFILADVRFSLLYSIAALLLIPFFAVAQSAMRSFKDPKYHDLHVFHSLQFLRKSRDLRGAFLAHFLLRLFFSFMVVFTPIYLIEHIGLTTGEFGLLMALVLLPFALLEFPLGLLADRKIGEKEILVIGFLVIAGATASLSFIESTYFWFWVAILFVTRVGASCIEISTESYFFKHVDGNDAHLMSLFRMLRPVGYLVGPLLGSIFLAVMDFKMIFVSLAVLLFCGIAIVVPMKDTR